MGKRPLKCSQDLTVVVVVDDDVVVVVYFSVSPIQVVSPSIVLSACVRPVCTEKIKAFNFQTVFRET
jgi:hypothetical protein